MTDPLRPFAQIIRALFHGRSQRTGAGDTATQPSSPRVDTHIPTEGGSLQSRLVSRIASIDASNANRMRETFIETVLLWELGEELAQDPAFREMVARVSQQLAMDSALSRRLHQLLVRLSGAS